MSHGSWLSMCVAIIAVAVIDHRVAITVEPHNDNTHLLL